MTMRYLVGGNAEMLTAVQAEMTAQGLTSPLTVVEAAADLEGSTAADDIVFADTEYGSEIAAAIEASAAAKRPSLSDFICKAVPSPDNPEPGAAPAKPHKSSTILEEDFEGVGTPTGWAAVVDRGSVSFDNGDSPIAGAASLLVETAADSLRDYAQVGFTAPEVEQDLRFRFRFDVASQTLGAGEGISLFELLDGETLLARLFLSNNKGKIIPNAQSVLPVEASLLYATGIVAGTDYYAEVTFVREKTNGGVKINVSATGYGDGDILDCDWTTGDASPYAPDTARFGYSDPVVASTTTCLRKIDEVVADIIG